MRIKLLFRLRENVADSFATRYAGPAGINAVEFMLLGVLTGDSHQKVD